MSGFIYEKDSENIVTITMDMTGAVNAMNDEFIDLMDGTMDRLEKDKDDIAGVIITSAKDTFFAGGDLKKILSFEKGQEEKFFKAAEKNKKYLRRLEQLGKPVVAAINGAALGGGCEICLACHRRIAIDDTKALGSFGPVPEDGRLGFTQPHTLAPIGPFTFAGE